MRTIGAFLKPEGEPLPVEDHNAEQFIQVSPHDPLGLFAEIVQEAGNG